MAPREKAKRKRSKNALASGFAEKLRAWIAFNLEQSAPPNGRLVGPRYAAEVAREVSRAGKRTSPTTVNDWLNYLSIPDAAAIAALEIAMGVPWYWLHSKLGTWKSKPTTEQMLKIMQETAARARLPLDVQVGAAISSAVAREQRR